LFSFDLIVWVVGWRKHKQWCGGGNDDDDDDDDDDDER